jgi:hypothetical protein
MNEWPAHIEERARIFELVGNDQSPLPNLRRSILIWDGPQWQEIDPTTGQVVSEGKEEVSNHVYC